MSTCSAFNNVSHTKTFTEAESAARRKQIFLREIQEVDLAIFELLRKCYGQNSSLQSAPLKLLQDWALKSSRSKWTGMMSITRLWVMWQRQREIALDLVRQ